MKLSELKVGDVVKRETIHSKRICEIVNITPSGLIDIQINNRVKERFNQDGRLRGADRWSYDVPHIYPTTEDEIKAIKKENERYKMAAYLDNFKWHNLDFETLKRVCEIVKG